MNPVLSFEVDISFINYIKPPGLNLYDIQDVDIMDIYIGDIKWMEF